MQLRNSKLIYVIDCKKAAFFLCLLILSNSLGKLFKRFDIILCIFLGKNSGNNASRENATAPTKENIFP